MLPASTSCRFSPEFPCFKKFACFIFEISKLIAEISRDGVQNIQCCVGMHAQLGQTMPMCHDEKESQDMSVVWFREETVEDRDSALKLTSLVVYDTFLCIHTCRRFSKSRAANCFISDGFEIFRIVPLPKAGISR